MSDSVKRCSKCDHNPCDNMDAMSLKENAESCLNFEYRKAEVKEYMIVDSEGDHVGHINFKYGRTGFLCYPVNVIGDRISSDVKVPNKFLTKPDQIDVIVSMAVDNFKIHVDDVKRQVNDIKKEMIDDKWYTNRSKKGDAYDDETNINEDENNKITYEPHIIKLANRLLDRGDSMRFILDTWNRLHIGDRSIGSTCACSVAALYLINTSSVNLKPNGSSGKGKSDASKKFLHLLPNHMYRTGSMSGKALWYDTSIHKGMIMFTDDVNLTEDNVTMIKQRAINTYLFHCHVEFFC